MSTWHKLGQKTGISLDTPTGICGLAVFAKCLAVGLVVEISADIRAAVAH